MPLTKKGAKIERAMAQEYGAKKGKQVFYASINKGKIKGAERTVGNNPMPTGGSSKAHTFKGMTCPPGRNTFYGK